MEGVERMKLAHLAMNTSIFPAVLASSGASQELKTVFTELLCKKKGFDVKIFVILDSYSSLGCKNGQIYKAPVISGAKYSLLHLIKHL